MRTRTAWGRAHGGSTLACLVLAALGCADLIGADFDKAHSAPAGALGKAGQAPGFGTSGGGDASAEHALGGAAGVRAGDARGAAGSFGGMALGGGSGARGGSDQHAQTAGETSHSRQPLQSSNTGGAGEAGQLDGAGQAGQVTEAGQAGQVTEAGRSGHDTGGAPDDISSLTLDGVETLDFAATDLAAVTLGDGLLDLFTIEGSRLVYRRSDDGWQGARYVEGHDASVSVPAFTSVAADFAGTRLDVFAVGNDGVLYYYYASTLHDDPEWIGPFSFYYYGADVARVGAGIGAASMSTTRFDVFAITSPGALGHVFGNEVYPTAEGWLSAFPYLVPLAPVAWASGMEVVSPWPTRLDVFFLSLSGRAFQHHWYDQSDGSYWGPDESPQREEIALDDATLAGGGIDALATAARAQGIDVFVRVAAATPRLYRLLYREGTWGVSNPSVGRPEPIALATCPERLFAAISWRGASVDLFGADADHRVWHSWFH